MTFLLTMLTIVHVCTVVEALRTPINGIECLTEASALLAVDRVCVVVVGLDVGESRTPGSGFVTISTRLILSARALVATASD